MSQLLRSMLIAWLCLAAGFGVQARADEAADVAPQSTLVVIKLQGINFANIRAQPDPRSPALLQVAAGATTLRATGAKALYGDSWWFEVQSGTVTGWANARLLGRLPGPVPLQAFVDIDDFQPVGDYAFQGDAYAEATVTSFDQCARRCVGDTRCVAVEYGGASSKCKLFETKPAVIRRAGTEVAARPIKTPAGGWVAQSAARFNRVMDQGSVSDGYRSVIAHGLEECASVCALDQRCGAFAFQRRKHLCANYERFESLVPFAGIESGVRQALAVPVDIVGTTPNQSPARAVAAREQKIDPAIVVETFDRILTAAGSSGVFAHGEIGRQGRVTFTLGEPSLGGPMHAAALPRLLEGTLHNLSAMIGHNDGRIVHLAFYAAPTAPPVILASSLYSDVAAAMSEAVQLQRDLDDLTTLTGLGVDPLALLKPLRR